MKKRAETEPAASSYTMPYQGMVHVYGNGYTLTLRDTETGLEVIRRRGDEVMFLTLEG